VETSPYSHSCSRLSSDRTTEARSTVTVFDRRLRWRQRHALAVWCCAGGGRAAGGGRRLGTGLRQEAGAERSDAEDNQRQPCIGSSAPTLARSALATAVMTFRTHFSPCCSVAFASSSRAANSGFGYALLHHT
jgi:hypothetical protein